MFDAAVDLLALLRAADAAPAAQQANGNFQRIVVMATEVGTDVTSGGAPTSFYTVITNSANEVVTMHPGLPAIQLATPYAIP